RGEVHIDVARVRPTLGTFVAHRLEPAHTPFVARAPRLDALPDPDLLLGQHLVEAGVFLRLGVQALLASALVVRPVAGPTAHLATVDLPDPGGQRAQEGAGMGDEPQ